MSIHGVPEQIYKGYIISSARFSCVSFSYKGAQMCLYFRRPVAIAPSTLSSVADLQDRILCTPGYSYPIAAVGTFIKGLKGSSPKEKNCCFYSKGSRPFYTSPMQDFSKTGPSFNQN